MVIKSMFFTVVYVVAIVVSLYYSWHSFAVISNQKEGIFTIEFGSLFNRNSPIQHLSIRDPTIPDLGSAMAFAGGVATEIATKGGNAATSVLVQASTLVTNEITAVETLISGTVPLNCSLGTRYACIGYTSGANCYNLPLNGSDPLSSEITQLLGQESALKILKVIPSVEKLIIVGNVFIFVSFIGLISKIPFARVILLGSAIISFVFFLTSACFIWASTHGFSTLASSIHATFEKGPLLATSIVTFICSIIGLGSSIYLFLWD